MRGERVRFELEVKRGGDERMEGEERGEEGKERMGEERGVRRRKGEGRGNEREGRRIGVKEGKELHGKGSVRGEQMISTTHPTAALLPAYSVLSLATRRLTHFIPCSCLFFSLAETMEAQ